MVNIVVSQNGNVTGDTGKIIAYEGQTYSEVLNIIHPLFPGARYYVEYKYDNTILRNELDTNNHVSIKVELAGYVKCQFVAVDIATDDVLFKSKSWNLIVKEDLKIEKSHYPCNSLHHYKHKPPMIIAHDNCCHDDDDAFNALKAFEKLNAELSNEEDIRFNEMQAIRQELAEIKAAIGLENAVPSTLDANTIITPGTYNANSLSIGFPKNDTEYELKVSYYSDDNVLQIAYEKNSNNVYYRSTLSIVANDIEWNDWALLTLQV